MAHDVLLTVGVYSVFQFEVTPATVIAFLTILGYSLYDTIVVFDRIKENEGRYASVRMPYADIVNNSGRGRTSASEITYSERGNLQGNQFWALAGRVYELAKAKGVGREIPTEWFLQDIRD